MAITLALEKLYTDVRDLLPDVPQPFGWREPTKKGDSPRIVWVPGDDNGSMGELGGARYPGRMPRPIATLAELFTVYIFAQDQLDPEDEFKQYKAARLLFDRWLGAVYRSAHGTFRIESNDWVTDAKERRFGACITVLAAIDAMVPDLDDTDLPAVAATGLGASIEVTELDVTETVTVPAAT